MRNYRKYVNAVVFILIILLSFNINHNPFVLSSMIPSITASQTNDALYEEITAKAKDENFFEKPQNAYIDPVWKKTPGRNGREIDIEKSYKRMKKEGGFNADLLVYNQVKPELALEDLSAEPIYRGHPEKQMTALMINVSWGGEHIPAILEILKKQK